MHAPGELAADLEPEPEPLDAGSSASNDEQPPDGAPAVDNEADEEYADDEAREGEDEGHDSDSSDIDFGSSDDDEDYVAEDQAPKERFVIHGAVMTEDETRRAMKRSGFTPASEGLDAAFWKVRCRHHNFAAAARCCQPLKPQPQHGPRT